ncbi:type I-E CRISPR-associated protein Cas5/CasD [Streptomyces sp. NPDC014733]|uniref:type I-E CRISPR-associated protein Cas5/CasD n=1 Tax=Streptomyces sp. NPDC014733 TaxID=3364885 RepID=UPI0036FE1598
MPGILIHLSGPLMSFGEHGEFTERDTHTRPTRSALIGLLAAADGRHRNADLADLRALRYTVRTDRPGTRLVDFHTIGGGLPPHQAVPRADGTRKPENKATVVTHRHYLADATFTVAIDGTDSTINQATAALRAPRWPLYLGRRSCPPGSPLLVATGLTDAAAALTSFPIHRQRPYRSDTVTVDLAHDTPPTSGTPARTRLADNPVTFDEHHRAWDVRTEYVTTATLPATLCAGLGTDWLNALARHRAQETPA